MVVDTQHWKPTSLCHWPGARGQAVHTCRFTFGIAGWPTMDELGTWEGPVQPGQCVFALWGLKALLLTVWYERISVFNWSVPTWPVRILSVKWGKLSEFAQLVSGGPGMSHSGAHGLTHWTALPNRTWNKACESVSCSLWHVAGGYSVNLECSSPFVYTWFLPGAPWNPALFSYLGLGGWMRLPPLTSVLPSRAWLVLWLTVSSSPGCPTVHRSFLATGWWSIPGQDVYIPWRNGHRIKPALAWQPLAVLSSLRRPAKPSQERQT